MKQITDFFPTIEAAQSYDNMIDWDKRLEREIPYLLKYLPKPPAKILDMACGSGRHVLALQEQGYFTVGIDVSKNILEVAKNNAKKRNQDFKAICADISNPHLKAILEAQGLPAQYHAIMILGNSISILGSKQKIKQTLENAEQLLHAKGTLILQVINKPITVHYIPLKQDGNTLIQRIMIPVCSKEQEHNMELHYNTINMVTSEYVEQSIIKQYVLTDLEMTELIKKQEWVLLKKTKGYTDFPATNQPGLSTVWVIKKA